MMVCPLYDYYLLFYRLSSLGGSNFLARLLSRELSLSFDSSVLLSVRKGDFRINTLFLYDFSVLFELLGLKG